MFIWYLTSQFYDICFDEWIPVCYCFVSMVVFLLWECLSDWYVHTCLARMIGYIILRCFMVTNSNWFRGCWMHVHCLWSESTCSIKSEYDSDVVWIRLFSFAGFGDNVCFNVLVIFGLNWTLLNWILKLILMLIVLKY